MKNSNDNVIGAVVRMAKAFLVAGNSHDPERLATASEIMTAKISKFIENVNKEDSLARLMFAESVYRCAPIDRHPLPTTWDHFFRVIDIGLECAEKKVETLEDPNETASFGRIKYNADILKSWYQSQDQGVVKWLNSVVAISGSHSFLMAIVPMDDESWAPLAARCEPSW